jgi:hypothetical protein
MSEAYLIYTRRLSAYYVRLRQWTMPNEIWAENRSLLNTADH